jgi:hypothetical protein
MLQLPDGTIRTRVQRCILSIYFQVNPTPSLTSPSKAPWSSTEVGSSRHSGATTFVARLLTVSPYPLRADRPFRRSSFWFRTTFVAPQLENLFRLARKELFVSAAVSW